MSLFSTVSLTAKPSQRVYRGLTSHDATLHAFFLYLFGLLGGGTAIALPCTFAASSKDDVSWAASRNLVLVCPGFELFPDRENVM
jgi:hypothetical protein